VLHKRSFEQTMETAGGATTPEADSTDRRHLVIGEQKVFAEGATVPVTVAGIPVP
jgi:hypothetical protein